MSRETQPWVAAVQYRGVVYPAVLEWERHIEILERLHEQKVLDLSTADEDFGKAILEFGVAPQDGAGFRSVMQPSRIYINVARENVGAT